MAKAASTSSSTSGWVTVAFLGGTVVGFSAFSLLSRLKNWKTSNNGFGGGAESHLWKIVEFSLTAALVRAGDKLDIYNKLYEWGPMTSVDLALRTGWSERFIREFLLQATAAGFCVYENGKFRIKADYAKFLRGPSEERKSMVGTFQLSSALISRTDAIVDAIKTGTGVDYDFGDDVCSAIDRKNGNFFRYNLMSEVLEPLVVPSTGKRVVDLMEEGIDVADVGCGCGTSTIVMAKQFPKSRFYAFESSPRSLGLIEENIKQEGVTNITVCDVAKRTLGDGTDPSDPNSKFGFVYSHDVLHDMTNPKALIQDVKKMLSNDGCWYIVDIDCSENIDENLKLPNAPTLFAFSCFMCLSMGTSERDGAGLGTCGFSSALAERWMKKVGFQYFEKRKIASLPYNACYLVA